MQIDLEVAEARQLRDEQVRRWHTWHVAALPNVKKFPPFKEFLGPAKPQPAAPKRRQTMEEQIAIAHAWSAVEKRRRSVVGARGKPLFDVDQEVPGSVEAAHQESDPQ